MKENILILVFLILNFCFVFKYNSYGTFFFLLNYKTRIKKKNEKLCFCFIILPFFLAFNFVMKIVQNFSIK